jgi:hypothetical protein
MDYQEQPYRDWVDQKPPGVFWIYRLALKLPLEAVRSVHVMGALFSAASAGALCVLARRFLSPFGAALAGGLFGLLSASPAMEGNAANTEVFMLPPLILSQVVFLRAMSSAGRTRVSYMLLCGALTGVAALFKQVAAVNWLFLLFMCPFLAEKGRRIRRSLSFAAWLTGGALLVWGLVLFQFWRVGGLEDFIHDVLTHNLEYVAGTQVITWILAVVCLALWWRRRRRLGCLWLAAWACTSLAGVSASGYFFAHYFQQLLPVLSLAAAGGAAGLEEAGFWGGIPVWARRSATGMLLAVLPVLALLPFAFKYTPEEALARIYPGNSGFGQMPELGRRIAEITRPEDRVYVFGAEPELLFYARRASATRYIFLFPLYGPYADAYEKQVATAGEITRAQPAAAFLYPNLMFLVPGTEQHLTSWTQNYLRENFEPDRLLLDKGAGGFRIVPAKAAPGAALDPQEVVGILFVRRR